MLSITLLFRSEGGLLPHTIDEFLTNLKTFLRPQYVHPHVASGHDVIRVESMERLGPSLQHHLVFELSEYIAAVWLLNVFSCKIMRQIVNTAGGFPGYLVGTLADSPFQQRPQKRIVDAVVDYSTKKPALDDPPLLTALRITDKLERLTPWNIITEAARQGGSLPPFDLNHPFGYREMAACIYKFYLETLEGVGMLPSWARQLVNREYVTLFIRFLRELGRDTADRLSIENLVEEDIRTALGSAYDEFKNLGA